MSEHVVYPITVWDPKNGIVSWWDSTKGGFWDSRNRRRRVIAAEDAADAAMAPDEDRNVKTSRARDSRRRSYSFTVPLRNAVSGKLVEVIVKLASRASALTVERLKRSVARQWKQSECLDHVNWRAVEILVSEADARRLKLKGEEDVVSGTSLVSGRSLCEAEAAAFGSSDSEEETLESPSLVPLKPDTLEFDPEKFAGLVTSSGPSKSDAEEGRVRLHFFVRGFARFESRRELSAALRTMQAAEYIAMRTMNEAPEQDNDPFWGEWGYAERVALDGDGNIIVLNNLGNTLLERDLGPSGRGLGLREYTTAATRAYASALAGHGRGPDISDIEALIHPDDYSRVLSGKRAVEETYGPLSVWDVSGVADLSFLFVGWHDFCGDVSGWNVCGVRSMRGMFWGCEDFNSNLAGWDVSTVRYFGCMFKDSKFNGSIGLWKVKGNACLDGMFDGCPNLTPDSVASLESWDLWKYASVWQVYGMFSGCYRLDWDSLPSWLWRWPSLIRFVLKPWTWYYLYDEAEFDDMEFFGGMHNEVDCSSWEYDEYDCVPALSSCRRGRLPRKSGKKYFTFAIAGLE